MAKFRSLEKGTLARRRNVACTNILGEDFVCDLRVLNGADDREILAAATAEAVRQKVPAKRGEPIYDFAIDVQTLLRAAVDSESPEGDPKPFFSSAEQIYEGLDRDRVHFLAAAQTQWQDEHSPLRHTMGEEEFKNLVLKIVASAEGDDSPFAGIGLPLLRSFTRALAVQCVILPMYKSASSSESSGAS